ncbi:DUF494 family protein [Natronospora cellulosivora (SeqCode)]
MSDNIIEIVSFLIQKMLNDEYILLEEEKIIQELIELGYNIQDIDQAFELIYNGTEIIEAENINFNKLEKMPYNRVLSKAERLYLPIDIQGLILKIIFSNILNNRENEEIIIKAIQNSYIGYFSKTKLWSIIEDVVRDQDKLNLITHEIPEFNEIISYENQYVN